MYGVYGNVLVEGSFLTVLLLVSGPVTVLYSMCTPCCCHTVVTLLSHTSFLLLPLLLLVQTLALSPVNPLLP